MRGCSSEYRRVWQCGSEVLRAVLGLFIAMCAAQDRNPIRLEGMWSMLPKWLGVGWIWAPGEVQAVRTRSDRVEAGLSPWSWRRYPSTLCLDELPPRLLVPLSSGDLGAIAMDHRLIVSALETAIFRALVQACKSMLSMHWSRYSPHCTCRMRMRRCCRLRTPPLS